MLDAEDWTAEQRRFLKSYFATGVLPVLTPLGAEDLEPFPLLPGLKLYLALLLAPLEPAEGEEPAAKVAIVPVPAALPRFITMPTTKGVCLARLEEVMAANMELLFTGYRIEASLVFRIARDADIAVEEEDAAELMEAMQEAILERRRRAVVQLTLSAGADPRLKEVAHGRAQGGPPGRLRGGGDARRLGADATGARPGFDELKYPDWPPQRSRDLIGHEDLWSTLQEQDVLLFHPYESFDPVVQLVSMAADDPNVLAIKQTLYRTSGDSPIVAALARAAEKGKQVTVLVELKARFDEAKNVHWARKLEDAGCYVIYGIAGYKTHAKALLIVRREAHRVRRYAHLSTGNYNDKTAKLYSDLGLMTSDSDMTGDVASFFNLLTGYSQVVGWNKLVIAPTGLRQRFLDLIDREIQASTPDRPGADHRQAQFAARQADLPGPVRGQPGGRPRAAQRPRHLLLAAGRARRLGKHRGGLDRRSLPGARADLLFPQRRPRRVLHVQRRLDGPQPRQTPGDPLSRSSRNRSRSGFTSAWARISPTTSKPGGCCPTGNTSRCRGTARRCGRRSSSIWMPWKRHRPIRRAWWSSARWPVPRREGVGRVTSDERAETIVILSAAKDVPRPRGGSFSGMPTCPRQACEWHLPVPGNSNFTPRVRPERQCLPH